MTTVLNSAPPRSDAIAFDSFRVDVRAGQLVQHGQPVPLRPKTWSVLLHLARQPGVLVSKDELLEAVWPDVAVTPDTLTKSIGELRQALGDDSKSPRYIETVHRRGFRFVAEMAPVAGRATALPSAQHEAQTPVFVGRAGELARLQQLLAKARDGERQIVFVTGPAGIGKSTLVETFLEDAGLGAVGTDVWVGRGACVEQHGVCEPYMPFLEALERLTRRPDADRLRSLLRRTAPTWLAQTPWLIGDDAKSLRRSLQAARPERMLREFAALTEALTSEVTLVLVLEDLHWSDPSTVDLLCFLGQRPEPARLLVVGTYRPAEVAVRDHPLSNSAHTLKVRQRCVDLPVHELTNEEVRSYLERRFPGAQFPLALAPLLHEHTDGNPLFVIGVVGHLLSRGLILDTAPGWALSVAPEKLELGIPDDVGRAIEAQLEVFQPADRELLEVASVGGVEFSVQGVAAALGSNTGDIEMRCEELTRAHRFLRTAGRTEWPDGNVARRYAFTHELYRQAVYSGIPDRRRQQLHQRMGEALEAGYGNRATDIAAQLAMHFQRGRDYRRAIRYLAAAAGRARQRFADPQVIGYLAPALALVAQLPDASERQRIELELRLALAPAISDLHGFASDQARENCNRTYALCAEAGSPEQRFQVLHTLCHLHMVRADLELLPKFAAELEHLAEQLATPEHRLLADSLLIRIATSQGRFGETCRLAEQRLPPIDAVVAHALPAYGADPAIASYCHYAFALWMIGHSERARATIDAALAAARRHGSPLTLTAAVWFSAFLEVLARNPAAVRVPLEEAERLSTEQGIAHWHAAATALRGWVLVQDGAVHTGIATLEQGAAALDRTAGRLFSTYIRVFLAEGHLRAGSLELGLAAAEEGLSIAESTLDRTYWPELWRLKGELLLTMAPPRLASHKPRTLHPAREKGWLEAEQCLVRALDLARESHAKSLELRAAISLARAWRSYGRSADAYRVLNEACDWFAPECDTVDLRDGRALLQTLAPAAARPGIRSAASRPQRFPKNYRKSSGL